VRACRCVCDRMVFSGPALRVRTPCVNVALARPREVCIDCGRKAGKRSVKNARQDAVPSPEGLGSQTAYAGRAGACAPSPKES
jgi:hypothetical protein